MNCNGFEVQFLQDNISICKKLHQQIWRFMTVPFKPGLFYNVKSGTCRLFLSFLRPFLSHNQHL